MTRLDKTKAKAAPVQPPIAAEDYPTLSEFFSAYLHQDFRNEYGSATKAANCPRVTSVVPSGYCPPESIRKISSLRTGRLVALVTR